MTLPAGYERATVGSRELVAQSAFAADLSGVLQAHDTLYEWAASVPQSRALRGRAPVYVATLPHTGVDVVVRHVWHGGMLAPVTGDRFRLPTRAPRELAASQRLLGAGIGTTEIVGYALYPAGPALRRVDVVSRYVPDAFDLGAVISELAPGLAITEALDAVRALLAQLADAGVVHPDLNVKNILLTRPSPARIRPLVIDVDVIRFETTVDPADVMKSNVARLTRSLRKWRTRFGASISDTTIREFADSCNRATMPVRVSTTATADSSRNVT